MFDEFPKKRASVRLTTNVITNTNFMTRIPDKKGLIDCFTGSILKHLGPQKNPWPGVKGTPWIPLSMVLPMYQCTLIFLILIVVIGLGLSSGMIFQFVTS